MRASILIAGGALILAAGGGYLGLEVWPQHQFRAVLDQAIANLPPGSSASYKSAHYAVLSHQAVVTGVTAHLTPRGDPAAAVDIAFDSLQLDRPNLDLAASWANAVAEPSAYPPERMLRVADAIALEGLSLRTSAVAFSQRTTHVVRPRLHPWALLQPGVNWNSFQALLARKTPVLDPAELQPILKAEAAMTIAFAYDHFDGAGMKLSQSLTGIAASYDIRALTAGSVVGGVIESVSAEGIAGSAEKAGTFAIDRLTLGHTDFREPMTRLMNGEELGLGLLNGAILGRLDYAGMTFQPPGQPSIHAGGIFLGPITFAQGVPVSGRFGWTDIRVTKQQLTDPKAADAFARLGLDAVTSSFSVSYDWDLPVGKLSIRDTTLKIDELGILTFAAELADVRPGLAGMAMATLLHARLRLDDASLVERMLRAAAAKSGADPAAFRQQMVMAAQQQGESAGVASPAFAAAGAAVSQFIAAPRSLTIALDPPQPISVAALRARELPPAALATVLGLTVTANK